VSTDWISSRADMTAKERTKKGEKMTEMEYSGGRTADVFHVNVRDCRQRIST